MTVTLTGHQMENISSIPPGPLPLVMTMKIPSRGGAPELVTDIFAQHARWSPSGDYIVFDGDFGTVMQVIPSSGGAPIRIDPDTIPIHHERHAMLVTGWQKDCI